MHILLSGKKFSLKWKSGVGAGEVGDWKSIWWTVWCCNLLGCLPVLVTCSLVATEIRDRALCLWVSDWDTRWEYGSPKGWTFTTGMGRLEKNKVSVSKIQNWLGKGVFTENSEPFSLHMGFVFKFTFTWLLGDSPDWEIDIKSSPKLMIIESADRRNSAHEGQEHVRKSRCYHKNKADFKKGANRISGNVK